MADKDMAFGQLLSITERRVMTPPKPSAGWTAMSDEDRLSAIRERADRSYQKIGLELGVSEHVLSKFVRSQGTNYHRLKSEHKMRRLRSLADKIAPLWNTDLSTPEIGEKLGVMGSAVEQAVSAVRGEGDERFPHRANGSGMKNHTTRRRSRDTSLRPIGEAFLREHHPDGTKYTPACIIRAMQAFPEGFQFKRSDIAISQRDFANLIQVVRVSQ